MAKLFTPYTLCPLVDQKHFHGISDDSKQNNVIVTLGNNIIVRYRLEDQKQVSSWSNKDKLTSAVVYDLESEKYIGIFDSNQIKIWSESDELDKVKKYKFEDSIFHLLASKTLRKTFVIFQNGNILSLNDALEKRKKSINKNIFKKNEIIESCILCSYNGSEYIAFFTHCGQDKNFYLVSIQENKIIKNITCKNKSNPLNNWCIISTDNQLNLMSLWTDGQLYSLNIFNRLYNSEFPGSFVQKFDAIDFHKSVALLQLGESHLVIYGLDTCEDGASMIVYSLKFHIIQARHHFKFFSNPPYLGKANNNILITVGNNLVVIPYELNEALLSSVIGSRAIDFESAPPIKEVSLNDWINVDESDNNKKTEDFTEPALKNIKQLFSLLRSKGFSQSRLCEEIILKLIDEKDILGIIWVLENFEDIPENKIAQLLLFGLDSDDSLFSNVLNGKGNNEPMDIELSEEEKNSEDLDPLEPEGRRVLIDKILTRNVDDIQMIPHLKNISLDHSLLLLKHIGYLLKKNGDPYDISIKYLISWTSIFLDAHYQECVLSRDPKVKELLINMRKIVDERISYVRELGFLLPYLDRLKDTKPIKQNHNVANKWYSIEKIELY